MDTKTPRPNPYVGPRAFQTGEMLYGRDRDILNLYYLLLAERVVLLFSPSGAGKSSLIQAGLIPRLKEKFSFIPIIRVNQEPPENFAKMSGFNRYIFSALLSLEEYTPQAERLTVEKLAAMSLSDYLSQRSQPKDPQTIPVKPIFEALIFDQFEEILTTAPNDFTGKQIFFDQLGEALHDSRRWALFSARQDYAAAFEPYLRAIPTRFANRYRLDLLDAAQALEAIQKPALEAGVDFTGTAAQKLIDDLRRVQSQRPDGTTEFELGRYVEAVQLQVVCYRLWNNLSPDETAITEKNITSIGSVDESLSAYYTDQVEEAAEKFKVPQRIIREWFNNQLITKQGMRSQVMLEPVESGGLDNRVIRFMETAHLVRAEKRAGSTWFELSHDRLIEPVRTDNEKWLKANLNLLQHQADLWEQQDRPDSLLLRDKELTQARLWASDHSGELLPVEMDFLLACKEQEIRALRLKRRNQVISVLGVVSMLLALIAFLAYRQAAIQRAEAQKQERVARAGQLAAQSHVALDEFPQRSLLLALEALKVTSNSGDPRQASAEEALREALNQPHGLPLGNHSKPVTVVAFSPDGRWLASGSEDATIEIWDMRVIVQTPKPIILNGNEAEIRVMAFSPDTPSGSGSRWLAAGGDDKNALLWDLTNPGAAPVSLTGHSSNIKSLAFSPDGRWLATGSVDETIRLWDLQSPDPSQDSKELTEHRGDISALAFSPDGLWLASGSLDATARLWQMSDLGATSIVLSGHQRNVNVLAFSPSASADTGAHWLATGSYDHTVRLWDLQADDPAAAPIILEGHEDIINALAFSPDTPASTRGLWLATGSQDHTARLWNLSSGNPAENPVILRGHIDAVNSLAFNPDGHWLATGSSDHTVLLWDLIAPDPASSPGILRGHDDAVFTLAFDLSGHWLATGSADKSTRLWDMNTTSPAENPQILRGHTGEISILSFSQNGHWLSSGSSDGITLLWNLNSTIPPGNPLFLGKSDGSINALSFSSSGVWLAAGGGDKVITLWNLNAADPSVNPGELLGNENPVTALAFSPKVSPGASERWLASGSQDGKVRLWDIQSNDPNAAPLLLGIDQDHPVVSLAFSPDAHWLAAASGYTVWLWNMADAKAAPVELKKHENRVTTLAFSPSGQWLATGSMDKTVHLWKMSSTGPAESPLVLSGHDDWVNVLAFSPDGRWLASGSQDHTARLWDLKAANPASDPVILRGHDDIIRSLAFSPEAPKGTGTNWLATGSDDHTVRLWNLHIGDPAADSVVLRGHDGVINSVAFSPVGQWLATGSSDHTIRFWPLQLDDLKSQACQSAGRNLTQNEWTQYFSDQEYEITCAQWPAMP